MAEPQQPEDHPAPEHAPKEKSPTSPHTDADGVPNGAEEGEATAYPTSDREKTETVVKKA